MFRKILFFIIIVSGVFRLHAQSYSKKQIDTMMSAAENVIDKNPSSAIQLHQKIFTIAKESDYQEGMIKCFNQIAFCYYMIGNHKKAIHYAKLAEKRATNANDYLGLCNALRFSAIVYSKLGFYEEGLVMLNKAFEECNKIKGYDDFHETKASLYQARSVMMNNNDPLDTSPKLFENYKLALDEFLKMKNSAKREKTLIIAYSSLGNTYADKKIFDSAYHYLNKSLDLSKKNEHLQGECLALYYLGYTSYNEQKYQQAIDYFETLIPVAKKYNTPDILKSTYQNLQFSYMMIKNKDKEQEYLAKYTELNDSLAKEEKDTIKIPIHEIIKDKEDKFIDEKKQYYSIIAIVCFLFFIAFFLGYKTFRKYKKEQKEKEQKEFVIEEKETQLTQLELKINDAFEEVLELAKKNDPAFLSRFKEVYSEFYEKLTSQFPQLTLSDIILCAHTKLNFSTKEIAQFTNASIRTVQSKKNRVRKKLDIESDVDLNKWMMGF
jgi:tetratricopeptide (TPR) repeat protein